MAAEREAKLYASSLSSSGSRRRQGSRTECWHSADTYDGKGRSMTVETVEVIIP